MQTRSLPLLTVVVQLCVAFLASLVLTSVLVNAAVVDIATDDAKITFGSQLDSQVYRTGVNQLTVNATVAFTGAVSSPTITALQSQIAALQAAVSAIQSVLVSSPLTIYVGPTRTYTTIPAAIAAIGKYFQSNSAVITIQVDDGTYTISSPISVSGNLASANLQIFGNLNNPANCVLQTTASFGQQNLLSFSGASAGGITVGGFTLVCTSPGPTGCNVGLVVQLGASIYSPANSLVISGFSYGLYVAAFSMFQGYDAYVPYCTFAGPTVAQACVAAGGAALDISFSTLSSCSNGIFCPYPTATSWTVNRNSVTYGIGVTTQVSGGPC